MVADWQLPPGVNRALWDYFRDPELARAYDSQLVDAHLLHIEKPFIDKHFAAPGRILDLGCGTGRLVIRLARRGFWCVGVDLSAEMLKVAAQKAHDEAVAVRHIQANMVNLGCLDDAVFDYAACLFNTLGMVIGADNRRRVVEHVYRVLRPGGKFVVHVHNRWSNLWHPQMRGWLIRDLLGRGNGDHVMPAHGGIGNITLHLFTRREVVVLLRQTGFHIEEILPISLRSDGRLRWPFCFGALRAYGYLIAAMK